MPLAENIIDTKTLNYGPAQNLGINTNRSALFLSSEYNLLPVGGWGEGKTISNKYGSGGGGEKDTKFDLCMSLDLD